MMRFLRGLTENTLANLVAVGVLALGAWFLSRLDFSIPLWVTLVILAVGLGIGYRWGRPISGEADLLGFHAEHLGDAILTLREILDGQLRHVTFEEFVERGILAPARFGLTFSPQEDIRLSVLEPNTSGNEFVMTYEAGHSVGRKGNFSLPMASMAGYAYQTGKLQWSNHVAGDDRWERHPEADPRRAYNALVAMPIEAKGSVVAVLNVVSTERDAFVQGDLTYVELLGTLIGLAWTIRDAAEITPRIKESQD